MSFFGVWADPDAALRQYYEDLPDLQAGRQPRRLSRQPDGQTLQQLCNEYLHAERQRVESGEITERTWLGKRIETARMLDILGKSLQVSALVPDDFARLRNELGTQYGPVVVKLSISRIRSLFNWAFDSERIDTPVRFGPGFRPPSAKAIRQKRAQTGKLLFNREELESILEAGRQPLKAMTLLAINGGFGNSDLSELPLSAIDLKTGWVDWPRPKTGIERRCPLWPETVLALREAIESRPKAKSPDDAGLAFLTRLGERWVRMRVSMKGDKELMTPIDCISREFGKLLKTLKIKRDRLNFYAVRHTFRTIADEVSDRGAVDHIMGHSPNQNDMQAVYVESVDDERLKAVCDHVRRWLFPPAKPARKSGAKSK